MYNPYSKVLSDPSYDPYAVIRAREERELLRQQRQQEREQQAQQRQQQQVAKTEQAKKQNANFFQRAGETVWDVVGNLGAGVSGLFEGIVDAGVGLAGGIGSAFGADTKWAEDFVKNDWTGENIIKPLYSTTQNSYLGDFGKSVFQGAGQMLPGIALTAITGGAAAPYAFGGMIGSSGGRGAQDALNDGASYNKALLYGGTQAAIEGGLEAATGGFSRLSSLGGKTAVKSIGKQIIKESASEALEEGLTELINPLTETMYKGSEALSSYGEADYWKGVGQAALVGGTVGGLMQGSGHLIGAAKAGGMKEYQVNNLRQQRQEALTSLDSDYASGKLTTNEYAQYKEQIDSIDSATSQRLGNLSEKRQEKYIGKYQAPNGFALEKGQLVRAENSIAQNANANGSAGGYSQGYSPSLAFGSKAVEYVPTQKALTAEQTEALNSYGKLNREGKTQIVFTDNLQDKQSGAYKNGVLYVSTSANVPLEVVKHEFTHSLEGSKAYGKYGNYVIKTMAESPEVFAESKLFDSSTDLDSDYIGLQNIYAKVNEGKSLAASERAVVSELVASYTSEKLFTDEAQIDRLARGERNLFQKMYDYIKDTKQKLATKKASSKHEKATWAFLTKAERLYAKAMSRGGTAQTDTTKYLIKEYEKSEETLASNIEKAKTMQSVTALTGNEFQKSSESLVDRVLTYYDSLGNNIYNDDFGDIELNKKSIKDSMAHGLSSLKASAFTAVPKVLAEGKTVDFQYNWKGRGYDTAIIAAPIRIRDNDYYCGVIILRVNDTQRFYTHEVKIEKEFFDLFKTESGNNAVDLSKSNNSISTSSIPQPSTNVNESTKEDTKFSLDRTATSKAQLKAREQARKTVQDIIRSDYLNSDEIAASITGSYQGKIERYLYDKLISAPKERHAAVAENIADMVINSTVMESILTDVEVEAAMDTIKAFSPFFHNIDLSGYKGELQRRYGKSSGRVYLMWSKKGGAYAPDTLYQELEGTGVRLDNINGIDSFFEMVDRYDNARATLKSQTKKKLSELSEGELASIRDAITKDVLNSFNKKVVAGKYAPRDETMRELRQYIADTKTKEQYRKSVVQQAIEFRDLAKRTYENASVLNRVEFKEIVNELAKLSGKKSLTKAKVYAIVCQLDKMYTEQNPLLKDKENPDSGYFDENLRDDIEFLVESLKDYERSGDFDVQELKALDEIQKGILHQYKVFDKVFIDGSYRDVGAIASEYIGRIDDKVESEGKLQKVKSWFKSKFVKIAEPRSVFRMVDNYDPKGFMTESFQAITDGETKANQARMDIMEPMEVFFHENKGYQKRLSNDTILVDGHKLSVGQAISLHLMSKRKQAQAGISASGVAMKIDGKIVRAQLQWSDIDNIEAAFTEKDKAFIELVHMFFNQDAKSYKMQTDYEMLGYTNVGDTDDYFPIRRDSTTIAKMISDPAAMMRDLQSIHSYSFNKGIKQGAKNQVYIENVWDIVTVHATQVGLYSGLASPLKAFNRIYSKNVSEKGVTTIRKLLNDNSWEGTDKYMSKFLLDLQRSNSGRGIISTMRSAYSKYQLGANVKVILSQVASLPTAGIYLDTGVLARGFAMKTDRKQMDKYSAYAKIRNHDKAIVRAESVLDKVGKVGNALTKPIQMMDRFTVGKIWNSCMLQVQKDKGYNLGSEQNLTEAATLFEKVVRETQPNYTNTERSELMRSDSDIVKSFTMFTSVPLKQYSRLFDAVGEMLALKARRKKGDKMSSAEQAQYKAAKKRLGRTLTAITSANIMYVLIGQLVKFLLDKERKDKDGNEITFWEDCLKDLSSTYFGMVPLVRDVYGYFVNGFEMESFALSMINTMMNSTQDIFDMANKAINGEHFQTHEYMIPLRRFVYGAGELTGIPVRNLNNTISGIVKRFSPETAYKYNSMFYSDHTKDLKAAIEKDNTRLASAILEVILKRDRVEVESESLCAEMLRLYTLGEEVLPTKVSDKISYEGKEYLLKGYQVRQIDEESQKAEKDAERLLQDSAYKNLTDKQKAKAIKAVYEVYRLQALAKVEIPVTDKRQQISKKIPLPILVVALAHIPELGADKDKKGESIAGSKKAKVVKYINGLSLSRYQKTELLKYLGYKVD